MHKQPLIRPLWLLAFLLLADPTISAADKPVDHELRSGHASSIAPWARRDNSRHYSGGFVGGGAVRRGDDRGTSEGTWGWDFHGLVPRKTIWLGRWHGLRDQGGRGAYKTEGPRLFGHGH
jgi:hypothetical protein